MTNVTLSVVIPACNESEYIEKCIEALISQGEYVDEIIVVDNNSSDDTPDLIEKYRKESSKVQLLSESRPGVVYARNRGFDAASGDIIGRIDADTIVGKDWAVAVHEFFERHDEFSCVTGLTYLYESPIAGLQRRWINWRLGRRGQDAVRSVVAVPGSNMAMRRSAWLAVRDAVSDRTDLHEDIDLSLCMAHVRFNVGQVSSMAAHVSGRRGVSPPSVYARYVRASRRTLEYHGTSSRKLDFLICADSVLHAGLWPLYRMYNKKSGQLSLRALGRGQTVRDLPVFS
ncbi:glycosyltransferase family 2 protein [Rhodococcus erythropolis]|uniref:glycosyltransferase n=1 Tax=Rhodococcus erythropolis TaxID=1833 RepID=UPI00294A1E80|nr:glycosyltransferase family 2 protein [Rhodococcus erythropolis]MDV6278277.1 glycosyltransferase family 2 protein [Rhodococcus erythropolis]